MAIAVQFDATPIPGQVLEKLYIGQRDLQYQTRKFWGVDGESSIYGGYGGRDIAVPVILYDAATFPTSTALAYYLDTTLNTLLVGSKGTLTIYSASNHAPFLDCRFDGFVLGPEGVKPDIAGTLGGAWFAIGQLLFRQHS